MSVVDPNVDPRQWAHRQNQLDLALERLSASVPSAFSGVQLQDAAAAFSRALIVFTPEQEPENNAVVVRNLQRAEQALAARFPGY